MIVRIESKKCNILKSLINKLFGAPRAGGKMAILNDDYIIKNCQKLRPGNYPSFLSDSSRDSLSNFLSRIDLKGGNLNEKEVELFPDLWKQLLSDAIIYLKSTDSRERVDKLHIERDLVAFGVQDLHKYFEEYRSFEAMLYGADRFYRDHVMHVFRVWLIGLWLIERFGKVDFDCKILDDYPDGPISGDEVEAMWCIIALTHDLGYPLDKMEKVQEKISTMMRFFGESGSLERPFEIPVQHHFINDFILKFIGSKLILRPKPRVEDRPFGTAIQSKFYLKFSKSLEHFHHGIISCILLMKNLVYFLESDLDLGSPFDLQDARQFCIRREILRAIACHTCTDIYHLQPNMLPFILILADEIQVWQRPTFHEIKSRTYALEVESRIPIIDLDGIQIHLNITEVKNPDGEQNAGKLYFISMCRKWHKWLRSALDSGKRNFSFQLKASVTTLEGIQVEYRFESKPGNIVEFWQDKKPKDLAKMLYS